MRRFGILLVPLGLAFLAWPARAETPLSLPDAIRFALQNNPELATLRQQHGIASAAVVIARTYPFNPTAQSLVMGAGGPESAGITNRVFNEHLVRLDIECRGQGKHRAAAAQAALSRVEWEIAAQEMLLAVRVLRAFNAVVYQRERLQLVQEAIRTQEDAVKQVTRLVEQNRMGRGDLILARADLTEVRATLGPARNAMNQALAVLRRTLGVVDEAIAVQGSLGPGPTGGDLAALSAAALENRPDLQALRLAVEEAEARVRLEVANRFGNPSIGPVMEYNETRAHFIGGYLVMPIPLLNTRRGEILQRQAERDRARLALRQAEIQVQEDMQAALTRLTDADTMVRTYRDETLKQLDETRVTLDKLFAAGEPGVDMSRVLDVRRRILRARGLYVDALFELSQAQADFAAALGDPLTGPPAGDDGHGS
jgi:cobalt-zinc-cadmium efflux system outer membrane protein